MGLRALLLALAVATIACPTLDDDDSGPVANDDDETPTPPPEPLADIIGVFNLINVVQPDGSSYVDFSGAFGTFAGLDTTTLSPGGYLGGFELGVSTFRFDLAGYPVPAEGTAEVVDLLDYLPWVPGDETWWDGGNAVAAGNYLSSRFQWTSEDMADSVLAYAVDDPLSPGGAAWTPGARVGFETAGGPDVVAAAFPDAIAFPSAVTLNSPAEGTTISAPAARDLEVTWLPADDGASVMVVLVQSLGPAYVASVPDTGTHTIPTAVLHDDLPVGTYQLIVARDLEAVLDHPQGDIILRTREEARATIELLPDLVITPGFGEPGSVAQFTVDWFTGTWQEGTQLDLGEGISIAQVFPDAENPSRALVNLTILPTAPVGARTAEIFNGDAFHTEEVAFWVYNLPPVNDCAGADSLGALGTGVFASSTEGLSNDVNSDISCLDWTLNGNDAVYRIDLLEGEDFVAWLDAPEPGDGALVLLEDCEDPTTAVVCADDGFSGEFEEIVFEAPRDGTWYLVVDAYTVAGYGTRDLRYELTILYGDLIPTLLDPGWIEPGATSVQTILGDVAWTGVTSGDVEFGDGITVTSVQIGGDPTLLEVTATADNGAVTGPREVVVSPSVGDRSEFADGLWVTDWPSFDTCAEAVAGPSVTPGAGAGYAVGSDADMTDAACFAWGTGGPEVFLPVDIAAGETLSVTANSADDLDDIQIFVLTDCGDALSCIAEASSDEGLSGEEEAIVGWAPPVPGRYYLGVGLFAAPFETFAPAWGYDLTVVVD